jgi:hypothetical protein
VPIGPESAMSAESSTIDVSPPEDDKTTDIGFNREAVWELFSDMICLTSALALSNSPKNQALAGLTIPKKTPSDTNNENSLGVKSL